MTTFTHPFADGPYLSGPTALQTPSPIPTATMAQPTEIRIFFPRGDRDGPDNWSDPRLVLLYMGRLSRKKDIVSVTVGHSAGRDGACRSYSRRGGDYGYARERVARVDALLGGPRRQRNS